MPMDVYTYLNTLWSAQFCELFPATSTILPLPLQAGWKAEFWIIETSHSLSGQRRWLCQSSLCEQSLQTTCSDTLVLQSYRSICCLLLLFGFLGVLKKGVAHWPQLCKYNWRIKFDADINHCPQSRVWSENWWGEMLVWSQDIIKGSEALVYEVEFFSAHVGEPAGQERSKWGSFHSWYASNRRITC